MDFEKLTELVIELEVDDIADAVKEAGIDESLTKNIFRTYKTSKKYSGDFKKHHSSLIILYSHNFIVCFS